MCTVVSGWVALSEGVLFVCVQGRSGRTGRKDTSRSGEGGAFSLWPCLSLCTTSGVMVLPCLSLCQVLGHLGLQGGQGLHVYVYSADCLSDDPTYCRIVCPLLLDSVEKGRLDLRSCVTCHVDVSDG